MSKRLYNILQLAEHIGVNHGTIRRWIMSGKLKPPFVVEHDKQTDCFFDDLNDEYITFLADKAKKWAAKTSQKNK